LCKTITVLQTAQYQYTLVSSELASAIEGNHVFKG